MRINHKLCVTRKNLGFLFLLLSLFHPEVNGTSIRQNSASQFDVQEILDVMKEEFDGYDAMDAFTKTRHFAPQVNNVGRDRMQAYLEYKFSSIVGEAGGKEDGYTIEKQTFNTSYRVATRIVQDTGVNYYAILSPKEIDLEDDHPLVLLANYDTDIDGSNPVEENGSGIGALLVIGSKIASNIHNEKLRLKHTVILAATDASLQKYKNVPPVDAMSGPDAMAKIFLPKFLMNRPNGIQGVLVLDNLMNFQRLPDTQGVRGFDRSYPEAYKELSTGNFAGDFLALVARGDEVDEKLVEVFAENWMKTEEYLNNSYNMYPPNNQMYPRLVKFIHSIRNGQGEGYLHFLKSAQSSFWDYKSEVIPPYPAILLTDTRNYRNAICTNPINCDIFLATTSQENLQFVHRTITTVYETVVSLTGGSGQIVSTLTLLPFILLSWRYILTAI